MIFLPLYRLLGGLQYVNLAPPLVRCSYINSRPKETPYFH